MNTFILLIFLTGGYKGAATSAEFVNLQACLAAKKIVETGVRPNTNFSDVFAVCVPKELP